jgi:hypothetical protein
MPTISAANRISLEAAWMASRQLAGRSATCAADQRRALKQLQLMETKKVPPAGMVGGE